MRNIERAGQIDLAKQARKAGGKAARLEAARKAAIAANIHAARIVAARKGNA